jgi:hypothetical protein
VKPTGEPDRRIDPDREFARSFAIGCGVLLGAFVLLSVLVYVFWMR